RRRRPAGPAARPVLRPVRAERAAAAAPHRIRDGSPAQRQGFHPGRVRRHLPPPHVEPVLPRLGQRAAHRAARSSRRGSLPSVHGRTGGLVHAGAGGSRRAARPVQALLRRLDAPAHEAYLRLGATPEVAGLGSTAVLGEYVWGSQQRFRLRLGPLTRAEFNNFLPGGEALRQLVAAVKTYVGEEKAWDVQLVLKRTEVPTTKLGQSGRMGLSTWMGAPRRDADADHVILQPVG